MEALLVQFAVAQVKHPVDFALPLLLQFKTRSFLELGQYDDAARCYRLALEIKADEAQVHCNLGNALSELGDREEALPHYEQALALKPDFGLARFNRALLWLVQGDFARGWPDYKYRWTLDELRPRSFEEGKKIGVRDGLSALWTLARYRAWRPNRAER